MRTRACAATAVISGRGQILHARFARNFSFTISHPPFEISGSAPGVVQPTYCFLHLVQVIRYTMLVDLQVKLCRIW